MECVRTLMTTLGGLFPLSISFAIPSVFSGVGREQQISELVSRDINKALNSLKSAYCEKINLDPSYRSFVNKFSNLLAFSTAQENHIKKPEIISIKFTAFLHKIATQLFPENNSNLWNIWVSDWDTFKKYKSFSIWNNLSDIVYRSIVQENKLEFYKCYRDKWYSFEIHLKKISYL